MSSGDDDLKEEPTTRKIFNTRHRKRVLSKRNNSEGTKFAKKTSTPTGMLSLKNTAINITTQSTNSMFLTIIPKIYSFFT